MKKFLIIFVWLFAVILAYGQRNKSINNGIGVCVGNKMYYGSMGLFFNHNTDLINKRIESDVGVGLRQSFAFGFGSRFRIYDISKKFQSFVSCNYSYQFSGKYQYDVKNNLTDYYTTSATQYLHYYFTGRFWVVDIMAIQLDCGYSQNISGIGIHHSYGPNENYDKVRHSLNSGLLIGGSLIVYFNDKN